jgi:hypothetical protein
MSSASLSVSVPEGDSALKEQNMQLLQEIADIKKECARIATVAETAQQTIDTLLRLLAKSKGDTSPF